MNASRLSAAIVVLTVFAGAASAQTDVDWTFDNEGFQSYVLQSFSPPEADLGPVGAEDPTLTLVIGQRYGVTIVNEVAHPFELLAKGATSSEDQVLLSMTADGPWEGDAGVNWVEDGDTVEFSLTPGLAEAMSVPDQNLIPGYRCGVHVTTMRGDFNVIPEPATIALAGLGFAALLRRRRG